MQNVEDQPQYISARELMIRWDCAKASVHRICARHGIRRLIFGTSQNSMVRYDLADIEAFEAEWTEQQ